MPRETEVKTKDGYDMTTLLMDGMETFEVYNEEAERPFREMFTHSVTSSSFQTDPYGDMEWDKIGEGEHLGTGTIDRYRQYMTVEEFGRALSWNRRYVEENGREELAAEFTELVEGYDKKEHNVIQQALFNAAADGSELWFDPPDKGAYSFSRSHDHTFTSTDELFYSDDYGTDSTSGNAHTPTQHIRRANAHLRHHDKDPQVAMVSSQFKEEFVDEVSWEADYHFPMANGLREQDLHDSNARVDGTVLMETPWLNDIGSSGYQFYVVADDDPIAFNEDAPVQLTRGEEGAPLTGPYQLFDAWGYARFGVKVTDPLSVVSVTADNLA